MITAPRVTDALALPLDVLIIRVSDLPQVVRNELGDDGAFAVTRIRGRSPSVLLDEASAQLLGEFREPSTIVEAVIRFSRRIDADPEEVLSESYPTLRRLRSAGYLVGADSDRAKSHQLAFTAGERVGGGSVIRCVRVLDDSELYQVAMDTGGLAALKVVRPDRSAFARSALRREAGLLGLVDGRVSPRLLSSGEVGNTPWLCMEWCEGVPITTAAAALRRSTEPDPGLLELCRRVVEAYAALHDLGVVHGDVHPGNLVVSPSGAVRIVDFGLARDLSDDTSAVTPRGGVQAYFDPQYAAALASGYSPAPASFASDQFALGAVLYHLLTGSKYLDFSIDEGEMLRQVVEDAPLPFTRRNRPPWPDVEVILARTLAKDPAGRFDSTTELARHLATVPSRGPAASTRSAGAFSAVERLLDEVVARARPGGDWFERRLPSAPFCSVAYGAAGVAAALSHVAVLRSDPELISLADEWVVRAARESGLPGAFENAELTLTLERTGLVSPLHRPSGVHAVQALVSHATGDVHARQRALHSFVADSTQPCANLDVTLGRCGTLLTAAILLETIAGAPYADTSSLTDLGDKTLSMVWSALDTMPPIPEGGAVRALGVAHGWAGFLVATLRWCRISGRAVPEGLVDRLEQLALLAQPEGLGARWAWDHDPARIGPGATMPGWCNGSAGFVHLWTTADAVLPDHRWQVLAERAAWDTYTAASKIPQLCCGLAGQAYALLEMYKHTGETRWFTAACEVGTRAATGAGRKSPADPLSASLHKGDVGIAALAADLADPEAATMPFFGTGS